MHLLTGPRGLLFVTLAEPLLYPFRGIGGWRKDTPVLGSADASLARTKNVPLGGLPPVRGPLPHSRQSGGLRFFVILDTCIEPIADFHHDFHDYLHLYNLSMLLETKETAEP